MARRKTTEEFIKDARKVHGDKYDYSKVEYIRSNIKVCIICPKHGEFWQTPAAHLSKQDCPKCAEIKKRISLKTDWNEILCRFKKVHGNKYKYKESTFATQHDKIKIYCKYHKFWFDQQIVHHLNGHGCPICNGEVITELPKCLLLKRKKFMEIDMIIQKCCTRTKKLKLK